MVCGPCVRAGPFFFFMLSSDCFEQERQEEEGWAGKDNDIRDCYVSLLMLETWV